MRRRAVDTDVDYDKLLQMQRQSWGINFPGLDFCEETFRGSLQASADRGEVFVYEIDGEIVGWLWLDLGIPRGNAHVRHVQVDGAHWGHTLGRHILEDAIGMCIQRGYRALTLNVTKSNARAMSLYEHLGFVMVEDRGERQCMSLQLRRRRGWRDLRSAQRGATRQPARRGG